MSPVLSIMSQHTVIATSDIYLSKHLDINGAFWQCKVGDKLSQVSKSLWTSRKKTQIIVFKCNKEQCTILQGRHVGIQRGKAFGWRHNEEIGVWAWSWGR